MVTGTDGSGAGDTLTTSTSLWAVCTGRVEGTISDPDCNSWPGVSKGIGVGISV